MTEQDFLAYRLNQSNDWIAVDYNCDDTPNLTYMAFWQVFTPGDAPTNVYAIRGFGNTPTTAIQALLIRTNLFYPHHRKSTSLCHVHNLTK